MLPSMPRPCQKNAGSGLSTTPGLGPTLDTESGIVPRRTIVVVVVDGTAPAPSISSMPNISRTQCAAIAIAVTASVDRRARASTMQIPRVR